MQKKFGGQVLFLNRANINTDEIIPAKYLTLVDKEALGPHMLEDLKLDGFDPSSLEVKQARVIVTRENFGCGSSREHAPWALEVNGITTVIAPNFARIFRQNMFNGGMLAIELPNEEIEILFSQVAKNKPVFCQVCLNSYQLLFTNQQNQQLYLTHFSLNPFDEALVKAGGWVEFADQRY